MRKSALFGTLLALCSATSAPAAVSIFGNSDAHLCYRAAEEQRTDASAMRICDTALADSTVSGHTRVATLVNRGILHVLHERYGEAIADYDRAIALDMTEGDAYLNKGLALLRRDHGGSEAVFQLDAAIERGSSEPAVAYYSRGVAHELNGDIVAAYNDLRRASELAPDWEAPARDLARFEVRDPHL